MDNIASAKMLSTTPFSINDILTRNNTSIFRRMPNACASIDTPPSSTAQQLATSAAAYLAYRQRSSSPGGTDVAVASARHADTAATAAAYSQAAASYYYTINGHNDNNNGPAMPSATMAYHHQHDRRVSHAIAMRRGSLDCFIAKDNDDDRHYLSVDSALDMRRGCASSNYSGKRV